MHLPSGEQSMNTGSQSLVNVVDGRLSVNGCVVESHHQVQEIGRGANAIVFVGRHSLLGREEAIKVWLTLRQGDTRDKLEQGVQEAVKLARAAGPAAVQIYQAQIVNGVVMATMEYFRGENLRDVCSRIVDVNVALCAAWTFLNTVDSATTSGVYHGDAHWNNVLVRKSARESGIPEFEMKLCDFGTSHFNGREASIERHWRIVGETVVKIMNTVSPNGSPFLREYELEAIDTIRKAGDSLTELERKSIRMAAFRDFLALWDRL